MDDVRLDHLRFTIVMDHEPCRYIRRLINPPVVSAQLVEAFVRCIRVRAEHEQREATVTSSDRLVP